MKKQSEKRSNRWPVWKTVGIVLVAVAFICYYAAQWYVDVFGQMGFDAVLYTVLSGVGDAGSDLTGSFCRFVLPRVIGFGGVTCVVLFATTKKLSVNLGRQKTVSVYPLNPRVAGMVSCALSVGLLYAAAVDVELVDYIENIRNLSSIYEDAYQDPMEVEITFPEEKRNLVYIFLESMESTFLPEDDGGYGADDYIPELHALANENVSFSHQDTLGGLYPVSGTGWTIAAMVSQTSGVSLKVPPGIEGNDYGEDGNFLNGLNTLTTVLREAGYYQTLMVGSEASFGGREQYYVAHGVDRVYDYYTAVEDGLIPEDYYVWWGFEDAYLYAYAKQELTEIAKMDQPFAFTMLTVDTHHVDGYVCEYCEDVYAEQYQNVYACASRQVAKFLEWLQRQDFYENTTVVLVGDHLSMDAGYMGRNIPGSYERTVYNCFINAAAATENTRNRSCCALDMFPTTLAAMGCDIAGDRLGLGTNLFSDTPTLMEEMGYDAFYEQLDMTSAYYNRNFYQVDN